MAKNRSSKSWAAFMLAAADDDQTLNTLGPALGVTSHFTGMTVIGPETKSDFHIWETQANYYNYALSEKSPFKFVISSHQLKNQKYQQLSVVAKQNIKKGLLFYFLTFLPENNQILRIFFFTLLNLFFY